MNGNISRVFIIGFNAIPIIGAAFYGWIPFDIFWLFWVETLIIGLFNALRILLSQGNDKAMPFTQGLKHWNVKKSFKYLMTRVFIFLFYALFIIVFIGLLANPNKTDTGFLQTLAFANPLFNLALILAVVVQSIYLIKNFLMSKAYYYASPDSYAAIFDARQIVIHIAVVIGAVGSAFLFDHSSPHNYGAIFMMSILCVAKCVYELFFVSDNDFQQLPSGNITM
ncbi:DUF6498-containing protein [Phnomibacter ginsenosidimutans]|uniref:Uncharacterized protein n=1 Tax=Phnomibacter ginsenosidimutans TaxID=2676868 RepID=A0A6I6H1M5_9BACT|nr:DUF6498-containing protein [Phnomibacter ginsenosidimutans]QGW28521.1 hypothetical protein GLV81_10790 [Phnomibacter ginsenosidimutans]